MILGNARVSQGDTLDQGLPRRYNGGQEGVDVSRWMPRSSKSVIGCAEQAMVGSTPMHSRNKVWRDHIPQASEN